MADMWLIYMAEVALGILWNHFQPRRKNKRKLRFARVSRDNKWIYQKRKTEAESASRDTK